MQIVTLKCTVYLYFLCLQIVALKCIVHLYFLCLQMFQTFSDYDIRYYTYETLKVLNCFCPPPK